MRLHEGALRVVAHAIARDRYLSCAVSDEELARRAVTAYKEATPNRSRSKPTPRELEARVREEMTAR